ncbi:MAG: ubiquinol-cytochrome c reductase iron-sulfur subunit [Armatimonadetes bacterium]|nr:ubiquinol-cytochrome c reductase iron-sulfur subunit [Armatimonadota bacterium]
MMDKTTGGDDKVPRRAFLDAMIVAGFALTVLCGGAPALSYLFPRLSGSSVDEEMDVGAEAEVPMGEGKVLPFGVFPTLVLRTKEGFKAFSAVCTHLGCVVKWNKDNQKIECPCHSAIFDTSGKVLDGPAPKPLRSIKIKVEDGRIILGGK